MSLLQKELIFTDIKASSSDEVFDMLNEELSEKGYIESTWRDAIVEREKNYPTGLGFDTVSIAIPHTDPIHIKTPYIALVRFNTPVVFDFMAGAADPVEAEFVVNLGIQHEQDQVGLLQKLMGVFANEDYVAALKQAKDANELYNLLDSYLSD